METQKERRPQNGRRSFILTNAIFVCRKRAGGSFLAPTLTKTADYLFGAIAKAKQAFGVATSRRPLLLFCVRSVA